MSEPKHLPLIVQEPVVLTVISLNGIALFLDAFPEIHSTAGHIIQWLDLAFLSYFFTEIFIKIRHFGSFKQYASDPWNTFDFVIVILSTPALFSVFFPIGAENAVIITILRLARILRLIRPLRLVPDGAKILRGVIRALHASLGILLILIFLNLILSIAATLLFGGFPEAAEFFGNPFYSMYSLLKIFTVEGWYEIPEILAERGASDGYILGLRLYVAFAVLICGIFGLSIANAVFVDTLVADNSDDLEKKVDNLHEEFREFRQEMLQNHNKKGTSDEMP
ncbi:MAG: ion transporter [Bacteroidetes bacterium]|nr:ion transporter [Bacteroidota bacterium]MCY4233707.1 ion transporter [Bacteroidota bacterium]